MLGKSIPICYVFKYITHVNTLHFLVTCIYFDSLKHPLFPSYVDWTHHITHINSIWYRWYSHSSTSILVSSTPILILVSLITDILEISLVKGVFINISNIDATPESISIVKATVYWISTYLYFLYSLFKQLICLLTWDGSRDILSRAIFILVFNSTHHISSLLWWIIFVKGISCSILVLVPTVPSSYFNSIRIQV